MSGTSGKTVLKLLLIIALMVQPTMFSSAMAEMISGNVDECTTTDMQNRNSADMPFMTGHHEQAGKNHMDDGNSGQNDCCSTPACSGAAVITGWMPVTRIKASRNFNAHADDCKGVILSSEIKPPRSLFS